MRVPWKGHSVFPRSASGRPRALVQTSPPPLVRTQNHSLILYWEGRGLTLHVEQPYQWEMRKKQRRVKSLTRVSLVRRCRHIWTWQVKLSKVIPGDPRLACAFEVKKCRFDTIPSIILKIHLFLLVLVLTIFRSKWLTIPFRPCVGILFRRRGRGSRNRWTWDARLLPKNFEIINIFKNPDTLELLNLVKAVVIQPAQRPCLPPTMNS